MILHHFKKKENKDKIIADKVYSSAIKYVDCIISEENYKIRRDFNSTFELTTILLFSVLFYLKFNKISKSQISQYLMNNFISDLDRSFREEGIGDMSIGKYVKSYVKKIYYRISKLDKIFTEESFKEFSNYIKNTNIQNNSNYSKNLSKFLFSYINILLKKPKRKDLSNLVFNYNNN